MSLSSGRQVVAIPGPSIVPDRVLRAMHRPMPNIYEGDLVEMVWGLLDELPALARTSGSAFMVVSNGHGAWQMAICNTLSRGDRILVLESGVFARVWGELAAVSGVEVETLSGDDRRPVDPAAVEERLRADRHHEIRAVLVVQTDTASSVRNDIAAIGAAIDRAGHPALYMVDCIASLGCERFEMDEWGVDIAVSASQKGLMMPPGLGFVWASPRAVAAHEQADLRIGYLDWAKRRKPEAVYQLFSGTPPIAHLYGLREALDMIAEHGLPAIWARHEALASAVHAAVAAWSTPDGLELNITEPSARSHAVTTVRTGWVDADDLRRVCEDAAGLVLGLGIAGDSASHFRIGHMGQIDPPLILGVLGTIEAALGALDVPIGASGVAAAARSIARDLT